MRRTALYRRTQSVTRHALRAVLATALPALLFLATRAWPAEAPWNEIDEADIGRPAGAPALLWEGPARYYELRADLLRATLADAPLEFTPAASGRSTELLLPRPDGTLERFRVVESPILSADLAALHPDVRTYWAQGLDDRAATARLDWTGAGFHAMVFSSDGRWVVDPCRRGDTEHYVSRWMREPLPESDRFQCLVDGGSDAPLGQLLAAPSGATLRTYRLVVTATGEYTNFCGGGLLAFLNIVSTLNRVNGIYEREVAIRLTLTGTLIYDDPLTDPFPTGGTVNVALLNENQAATDAAIGAANYDVGHILTQGANNGLAAIRATCVAGNKARGGTSGADPTEGDAFDVDYVAHELGHQFGANHTFNGRPVGTPCAAQRNPGTAVETGSGSTIMGYAGLCPPQDVQDNTDPYFHTISFDEITNYREAGGNCGPAAATGNNPPTVAAVPNFVIPRQTPFELSAVGDDLDGDALTYCWEQVDLGPPAAGAGPLFRSYSPTPLRTRVFPNMTDLLEGNPTPWEQLPAADGTVMNFRCTVRDNRAGGGGVDYTGMNVTANGAPFRVLRPNGGEVFRKGRTINVQWIVGGGAVAGRVDIYISYDGGATFALLLGNTLNDGAEAVTLGATTTGEARIKIKGRGNIFFDVSDGDFAITGIPTLAVGATSGQAEFASVLLGGARAGGAVFGNGAIIMNGQVLRGPGANFPDLAGAFASTTPGVAPIRPVPYLASRTGPPPFGEVGAAFAATTSGILWSAPTRCRELFPPNPDLRATVNIMRGTATFTNTGPDTHCRPGYSWGMTGFIPTGAYGALSVEGSIADPVTGARIPITPIVMAFDGLGSLVSNGVDFASGSAASGFTLTPAVGGFALSCFASSVGPVIAWPNGSASVVEITVTMIADPGFDMTYDATVIPQDSSYIDFGGGGPTDDETSSVEAPRSETGAFAMTLPYPNPTGGATYVELVLPRDAAVRVSVIDARGREVALLGERSYPTGRHVVAWDGRSGASRAAPGVYFLVARGAGVNLTQRVVLTR